MSLVAIVPVASLAAANAALEAQNFGPSNFSVPAYGATGATHAALHTWEDAAFREALEATPEVIILAPEEGEELPTDPIEMTQALITAQGAQWGAQAPALPTTAQVQGAGPVRSGFGFFGRTYLEIMRNKETTGTLLTNAEALVTSRTG